MGEWSAFLAALAVFFASHAVLARPAIKRAVAARLGARGFTLAYSAVSTAALAWVIVAAGRAPVVVLWSLNEPSRWLVLGMMLVASVLLALSVGRPNPLSFGGGDPARFDPAHPGLVAWLRHPLLWVLLIWSSAHLIANGTLAHVIVFGSFAGFSLIGMRLIDWRRQRALGPRWAELAALPRRIEITPGGLVRLALGVALYVALIQAHGPVIGVAPLP